ncbi:histidine phosphatase family protein [Nocardiopsis sp. CNT312]|uniref:histidine phosphatase family protein n=1 Tax=Nocardiopsis sp. CNT312 TaxID=1137268 RepID=UPI0009DDB229|nr:histidine phosphatase family protein [Nocardiopsis sp. CNT312]
MADIYLIRHAHYAGHSPGYHAPDDAQLSPQGGRDTIAAAQRIPVVHAIVSSPLRRALETAEILAEHSGGLRIEVLPELREWRSPTAIRAIPPEDFPEDYAAWRHTRLLDPASRYGDGESPQELAARAARLRNRLAHLADRYGPVLVVSHKLLFRALTEMGPPASVFTAGPGDTWPFLGFRRWDSKAQYPHCIQLPGVRVGVWPLIRQSPSPAPGSPPASYSSTTSDG